MSKPGISKKRLLNEIHSQSTRDFLDSISSLLQELEEKPDPETTELYLVENIYQFLEKFKMLQSNLEKHLKEDRRSLPGNKLSNLMSNKEEDIFEV